MAREITGGEWTPCFGEKDKLGVVGTKVQGIALVCGENENKKLWNTQLIAAAPELYDALELIYKLHCDGEFSLPDKHYIAITKAATALSKAQGE